MKSNRGGKRPGAGRPKKEPTTTIRVPVSKVEEIQKLISSQQNIAKTMKDAADAMDKMRKAFTSLPSKPQQPEQPGPDTLQ